MFSMFSNQSPHEELHTLWFKIKIFVKLVYIP